MKCQHCKREYCLSWHIKNEKWYLLPRKYWRMILCLDCFISLLSKSQSKAVILLPEDFDEITIASKRVRGKVIGVWPLAFNKTARRSAVVKYISEREAHERVGITEENW